MGKVKEKTINFVKQVLEYKKACEANIVAILWKDTEMFRIYDNLTVNDFSHKVWQIYFKIGQEIIIEEKKEKLDVMTVGFFLEKYDKLKKLYDKYGGYETIDKAKEYVEVKNIEGYITELKKWTAVLDLVKMKFPVEDRLEDFKKMSVEDIYNEYDALLNHIFSDVEGTNKVYDLSYRIKDLVYKLNEGLMVGLPLYNSPILSHEIGGSLVGNITLIGGISGAGKTAFIRQTKIPSIIKHNEKMVVMINEEGLEKWQQDMLVWIANNIYKKDIPKDKVRYGKYTKEFIQFLLKCAEWMEEHKDIIKVIPLKQYSTSLIIKYIKKFSSMGVKYFVLDTFKADANTVGNEQFWLNMQQNMVRIYDTIKPESKNVHIDITFQLNKGSTRQRYYMQDNIGMAKNMVDVASTCLMIRNVFDDEYTDGKRPLKVYRLEGKNKRTQIPVKLDRNKDYQIIFIIKNRAGATNKFQIVVEHDLKKDIYREVGITTVPQDF